MDNHQNNGNDRITLNFENSREEAERLRNEVDEYKVFLSSIYHILYGSGSAQEKMTELKGKFPKVKID